MVEGGRPSPSSTEERYVPGERTCSASWLSRIRLGAGAAQWQAGHPRGVPQHGLFRAGRLWRAEAAAQTYSTRADRLSLTQAALLVGIPPRRPTTRSAIPWRPGPGGRRSWPAWSATATRAGVRQAAATSLGLRPATRPPQPQPERARQGGPGEPGATQHAPWFVGWVLTSCSIRRIGASTCWDLAEGADGHGVTGADHHRRPCAGGRRAGRWRRSRATRATAGAAAVSRDGAVRRWWVGGAGGTTPGSRVNLTGAGGVGGPGSAFKTFALVAALSGDARGGVRCARPAAVGRRGHGPAWRVANYEGHGFGKATLRTATALRSTPSTPACWRWRWRPTVAPAVARAAARMGWTARCGRCRARSLDRARSRRWRWRPPTPPAAEGRRSVPFGGPDHRG